MGFHKRGGFYKVLDAPTTNWTPLYPVFTTLSKGLKIHYSGNASDRPLKAHSSSQCAGGATGHCTAGPSPQKKSTKGPFCCSAIFLRFYSKRKKEIVLSTKLSLRIQKIEKWAGGGIKFWWERKPLSPKRHPIENSRSRRCYLQYSGSVFEQMSRLFLKHDFQKEIAAVVIGNCLQRHFLYSYYYDHRR